jgi:hypothetical protein
MIDGGKRAARQEVFVNMKNIKRHSFVIVSPGGLAMTPKLYVGC